MNEIDEVQLSSDMWSVACRLINLKERYFGTKFKFDELNIVDLVNEVVPLLQDGSRVVDSNTELKESLADYAKRIAVMEDGLNKIVAELFGDSYANGGRDMLEVDTRTCADILEQVKKLKEEKE